MKVCYRSIRRTLVVYQQTRAVFCCEEMARQRGKLLGFGARGVDACTSREVSLFVDRAQANGRAVLEVVPIQCCPFCGEVIETIRAK
jgi:hypothetical protein